MADTPPPPVLAPLPQRTPPIDRATGLFTRPWMRYFELSWRRQGGADAPSNDALDQSLAATQAELDATQAELAATQAALAATQQELDQTQADLATTQADLAAKLPDGAPLSVARYQADGSGVEASPAVVVDDRGFLGVGSAAPLEKLTVHNGHVLVQRDDGLGVQLFLNSPPAVTGQVVWQTSRLNRWILLATSDAETGGNAGTNLDVRSRRDDGAALTTVLRFERQTGNVLLRTLTSDPASRGLLVVANGIGPTTPLANATSLWSANRGGVAGKGSLHVQAADGTSHVLGDLVGLGTLCAATLGSGAAYQALTVKGSTLYVGQSSVQERALALVQSAFVVNTDATRTARLTFSAYDATAAREGVRVEASGTAPLLGFYGASAVAKPTVSGAKGGNAALGSLVTALAQLGLVTDSTT